MDRVNDSRCILCNSNNLKAYIRSVDIETPADLLKCRSCGLVFFAKDNKKLDDTYWNRKGHAELYEEDKVYDNFEKEFVNRMKTIEKFKNKGKLLDIGCGLGHFLNIAKQDDWDVCGIEISQPAAEYARNKYGLKVCEGTVENLELRDQDFDVITMWDVIEHIQNPAEALSSIRNKLKTGGLLVIKTPDEKSLFKAISKFLYFASRRKASFFLKYVYYLPHYFYYSKETMHKLLEKFGFNIVRIDGDETDYRFAREKIKYHYKKFFSKNIILIALPVIYAASRMFKLQNKMIVYAIKG